MELVPAGTPDPSPFVYDSTMYAMAGLTALAAIAHYSVRPVPAKYFENAQQATAVDAEVISAVSKTPGAAAAAMLPSMASHMTPASVLRKH